MFQLNFIYKTDDGPMGHGLPIPALEGIFLHKLWRMNFHKFHLCGTSAFFAIEMWSYFL